MMSSRLTLNLTIGFTALHAALAIAIASQPWAYGTVGARNVFDDVQIYESFATRILDGQVPYRDFPVEYPVLSLPFFVLPKLIAADSARYRVAFAFEMLAADALTIALLIRWLAACQVGFLTTLKRLGWYTLAFATLCPLVIARFDLLVMTWTFLTAATLARRKGAWGGMLAASGTLLKIVPGLAIVPAVAGTRADRPRRRAVLSFVASITVGALLWYAIGGPDVAASFRYHAERGIEIGSFPAGYVMIVARLTNTPVSWVFEHKSIEILTPWSTRAGNLCLPMQALALFAVARQSRTLWAADPARATAAALLAFIAFGKVLSPQYMIWSLPLVACIHGRHGDWSRNLTLLACVLTTLMYPLGFHWMLQFRGVMVGLLNARNLLLIGIWGWLTFGPAPPRTMRRHAFQPHFNRRSVSKSRAARVRVSGRAS